MNNIKILKQLRMKEETMNSATYVYVKSEPNLYTVGFFNPEGEWIPESDHDTRDEAAARVHYLNGGN